MARVARRWWIVAALSATTTVGFGTLVYAYAVFLIPLQQALDTGRTVVAGGQAVTLAVGGAAAIPAGRWLDRRSPRLLMLAGSLLGTLCVLAWSRVQTVPQLYLVSLGLGVAGAGVLYEAAFATVVRWFTPTQRSTAILVITIVGGFASTIFFPLCGVLIETYGWRDALVGLALVFGLVTGPLHLTVRSPRDGERPEWEGESTSAGSTVSRARRRALVSSALRDRTYWLLAGGFVTEGAANAVIALHIVAYLTELGHSTTVAASVAGLLGVLSVAGRLVTTVLQRRRATTSVVAVIFAIQAFGALLLPALGGSVAGAVACVVAFGIGQGVATIARPVVIADRYDIGVFATLSGILTGTVLATKALAPLGAAALHQVTGGYLVVMLLCGVGCLAGCACIGSIGRGTRVRMPRASSRARGGDETQRPRRRS